MNARQLASARKRLDMVAHAAADLRLALDTLNVTREQLHETIQKDAP